MTIQDKGNSPFQSASPRTRGGHKKPVEENVAPGIMYEASEHEDNYIENSGISAVESDKKRNTAELNDKNPRKEDLDAEYYEQKTVTINLVKNYSLYRKANDKTLPKRMDYIGSSVSSSRTLSSNKAEIEAYFPNIIGLAPNNDNFITRVKQYLNNIQIKVDELGKTFDIGFHWKHKKDYYSFKDREDKINADYDAVPRNNITRLRDALKNKINLLNALEGEKYQYGYPNNIEDYLMYRHCLLYNDVAKDVAFVNSDANIRFYFKDDQKEAEKLRKFRNEIAKAKTNYVSCLSDEELFEAVYIQYCNYANLPVVASLAEDRLDKEIKLDKFSTDDPIRFNSFCADKDIRVKALIEKLINRGELIRLSYNQNITTPSGEVIGANMKEAVAWFNNPDNTSVVKTYMTKLQM